MQNIRITGFGRFHGHEANPTEAVVHHLQATGTCAHTSVLKVAASAVDLYFDQARAENFAEEAAEPAGDTLMFNVMVWM
jgi:pyrrolidone-carboxylate peptidase